MLANLVYGLRSYKERTPMHVASSKMLKLFFLTSVCYKTLNDLEELKVHGLLTGWNLFMISFKEYIIVVLMILVKRRGIGVVGVGSFNDYSSNRCALPMLGRFTSATIIISEIIPV
jgi:hypothetical protein